MSKPRGFSYELGMGASRGPYRYTLAPWVWATRHGEIGWELPGIGGIDLRPRAGSQAAGGSPIGFGFCVSLQSVTGAAIATCPHMNEYWATNAMRDAWQSEMGYRPQGNMVRDLLWDQLTTGSDPTGESGPKPLMPTTQRVLELHVPGHSLVHSERFEWGVHPHTNRVRDVLRADFEKEWEDSNGDDHCRRCLDYTCEKYRVKDWHEFVPPRLHPHVPGRLPHRTTITESFTGDADTLGPDLSWTELEGDIDVVSNRAKSITAGLSTARADSDLSSSDNYAQIVIEVAGVAGEQVGPFCRKDGTATLSHYSSYKNGTNSLLRKRVSGTHTTLRTDAISVSLPDTAKVSANGSTIEHFWNGASLGTTTDTDVSTGLRCGLFAFREDWEFDSFEAADLAAAGRTTRNTRAFPLGVAVGMDFNHCNI